MNMQFAFRNLAVFTVLILPTREHWEVFSSSAVFFHFFLQCFIVFDIELFHHLGEKVPIIGYRNHSCMTRIKTFLYIVVGELSLDFLTCSSQPAARRLETQMDSQTAYSASWELHVVSKRMKTKSQVFSLQIQCFHLYKIWCAPPLHERKLTDKAI